MNHTEWNVLRRRSDGEIVTSTRGRLGGGDAPEVPPRFDGKALGKGLGIAPADIWADDGSLHPEFEVVGVVSDAKPYSGLDLIDADGTVTKKPPAEVLALDAEVAALAAEASIDGNVAADMNYRELWEQWKFRTSKTTAYRDWLRSKLRGIEP